MLPTTLFATTQPPTAADPNAISHSHLLLIHNGHRVKKSLQHQNIKAQCHSTQIAAIVSRAPRENKEAKRTPTLTECGWEN